MGKFFKKDSERFFGGFSRKGNTIQDINLIVACNLTRISHLTLYQKIRSFILTNTNSDRLKFLTTIILNIDLVSFNIESMDLVI